MRCMKRNKRTIYVCEEYQDGAIRKFKKPIQVKINYQPTNSESDLIALGMDYPMHMRIKADLQDARYFKPSNRIYINTIPKQPYDEMCEDAEYEVSNDPLKTLNSIEVGLTRLSDNQWK